MKDIFQERERGYEAGYFRDQDQKLLAKMRERAGLTEVMKALAAKLKVDNTRLLGHIAELGLTGETGAAMLMAPMVQVAWASGSVSDAERKAVMALAASRGIAPGSPAHAQLESWLKKRPSDDLFATALAAMRDGLSVLPKAERDERIKYIVASAHTVAEASGGGLLKLLGLSHGVHHAEEVVLDAIASTLRLGK